MVNKLQTKINNSYESEPSSGSGSLGESGDYSASEEEIISLPNLLKPNVINSSVKLTMEQELSMSLNFSGKSYVGFKSKKFPQEKIKDECKYDFHEKEVLVEYYNVDNSCNAVDINLTNDIHCGNDVDTMKEKHNNPTALSFDGKIKSISEENSNISNILQTNYESKYTCGNSPDLFDDEDYEDVEVIDKKKLNDVVDNQNKSVNSSKDSILNASFQEANNQMSRSVSNAFQLNSQRDWELLRRIKNCLAGVPPPPALTIPQIDILNAVVSKKEDILNFHHSLKDKEALEESNKPWLFKPTHTIEETKSVPWREILAVRQHGISFNVSKACENNELLSLAVVERFIGAETATSYLSLSSSPRKSRSNLKKLTKSPGNRLSHLAKRRAVFSSANLVNAMQKPSTNSLGGLQILLDKKKHKNRRKNTPKRFTPSNKKRASRKTPTSSAKKGLLRGDITKPGPSRENSKRALFQSPAKQIQLKNVITKSVIKPETANRVEKSKRALFSSTTKDSNFLSEDSHLESSQSNLFGNLNVVSSKRKRVEDDDNDLKNSKVFCGNSENLTPRALKIKSQSFCVGATTSSSNLCKTNNESNFKIENENSSNTSSNTQLFSNCKLLSKACSDTTISSNQLSENHKKKLLWSVSQALQLKSISVKHENFKQYATVLARVVRRLFQEFFQKNNSSTSETMLKLAKKHVYSVIAGKNADEIYLKAKLNIESDLNKMSSLRLSGYIGPDEFEKRKSMLLQNNLNHNYSLTNLLSYENSSDIFDISQNSSLCTVGTSQQTSSVFDINSIEKNSLENYNTTSENVSKHKKLPIQSNYVLNNSSSKSNLCGFALRENVDCEQRKSTQKNFTGKDQKNVSPYVKTTGTTGILQRSNSSLKYSNIMEYNNVKVKRQITFDS